MGGVADNWKREESWRGRLTDEQIQYIKEHPEANEDARGEACEDCKGTIALTDVEGHYSGQCRACRGDGND